MSDESKPPPSDKKKISVILAQDLIRRIEDAGLTQTEAVLEALKYYFSPERLQIEFYKKQIIEDEKKIAVLEATYEQLSKHNKYLEIELGKVHDEYQAHLGQVQGVLKQLEDEKRKSEEKILLLEDGSKKKAWWKFW
jgi:predicted RNase H-like nuclease (RuvC/YqgF family)